MQLQQGLRVLLLIVLSLFLQFDLIENSTSGTWANNISDGSSASQGLFTCVRYRSMQRLKRHYHRELRRLKQQCTSRALLTEVKSSGRASKVARGIKRLPCNQTDQPALPMDIAILSRTQFQQISAAKQKLRSFHGVLGQRELSQREQRLNRLLQDKNDIGLKAVIDAFGGARFDNKSQLVDGENATDVSCLMSSGGSIIQYDACEYQLLSQHYADIAAIERALKFRMNYCRIPILPDSTACPTTITTTSSSEGPTTAMIGLIILVLLIPIFSSVFIAVLCWVRCSTICRERRNGTETETEQTSVASESASLADSQTDSYSDPQQTTV